MSLLGSIARVSAKSVGVACRASVITAKATVSAAKAARPALAEAISEARKGFGSGLHPGEIDRVPKAEIK